MLSRSRYNNYNKVLSSLYRSSCLLGMIENVVRESLHATVMHLLQRENRPSKVLNSSLYISQSKSCDIMWYSQRGWIPGPPPHLEDEALLCERGVSAHEAPGQSRRDGLTQRVKMVHETFLVLAPNIHTVTTKQLMQEGTNIFTSLNTHHHNYANLQQAFLCHRHTPNDCRDALGGGEE